MTSSPSQTLTAPKRKRYAPKMAPCPFPPPPRFDVGNSPRCHFQGELVGDAVLVRDKAQGRALYRMGCFGKGMLTRSEPWPGDDKTPESETPHRTTMGAGAGLSPGTTAAGAGLSPRTRDRPETRRPVAKRPDEDVRWEFTEDDWIELVKLSVTASDPSAMSVDDCSVDRKFSASLFDANESDTEVRPHNAGRDNDVCLPLFPRGRGVAFPARIEVPNFATQSRTLSGQDETEHRDNFSVEDIELKEKRAKTGILLDERYRCPQAAAETADDCLQLSLTEAFFLCFGLGSLSVLDRDGRALDIRQLWRRAGDAERDFAPVYAAYHHFRSRAWVVRSGLKFGVDFLLYKHGPSFHHASYSVVVVAGDGFVRERNVFESWRTLSALERVTSQVNKDLLLCYVEFADGADTSTPYCLGEADINEVLVRRWVPSEERDSV